MKHKFYRMLALIALLLPFTAVAIDTYPYEPSFASQPDPKWTFENTHGSWAYNSSGYFKCTETSGIQNAYIFSPVLKVQSGCRYTFKFTAGAGSTGFPKENFNVYLFKDAGASTSEQLFEKAYSTNSTTPIITDEIFTFSPTEDCDVYFSIQCVSNYTYSFWMKFTSFSVTEESLESKPKAVSGFTAVAGADQALTATLTWTNPTLTTTGEALTIKKFNVYRNDELLSIADGALDTTLGAEVTYTDHLTESGVYNYAVEVVASDDKVSSKAKATTVYVGPLMAIMPYTHDFSDALENSFWTVLSLDDSGDSGNNWTIDAVNKKVSLLHDGYHDNNDWLISRPLKMDAAKAYRLSFKAAMSNKINPLNFEVSLGNATTAEAATTIIDAISSDEFAANDTKYAYSYDFTPSFTGDGYIGFHEDDAKLASTYYSNSLSIYDFSIKEIPIVPNLATNLTASPADDESLKVILTFNTPTTSTTGLALGELTASVYRDGKLIADLPTTAGKNESYVDTTIPGNGYYTYYVIIKNANGSSEEEPMKVTTDYVGVPYAIPFASDFNDADQVASWTVVDNSETQGYAWTIADGMAKITETKANNYNDYLITPPMKMKAGKVYQIKVNGRQSSNSYSYYDRDFKVMLGKGNTAEAQTTELLSDKLHYVAQDFTSLFSVDSDGNYSASIAIQNSGSGSATSLIINSIEIIELKNAPQPIADLTATSNSAENKITLSWTMPTKNITDKDITVPLTAKVFKTGVIEAVAVINDAAAGSTQSWTDNSPSAGYNVYDVVAVMPDSDLSQGGESEKVSVRSDWFGDPYSTPYASDFANKPYDWTVIDNDSYPGNAFAVVDGVMTATESSSSNFNDWIITPPLSLKAGIEYNIAFDAKVNSSYKSINIKYGTAPDKESISTVIKSNLTVNSSTDYATYTNSFTPVADGTYYLGLNVTSSGSAKTVSIASIKVSAKPVVPAAVSDLSATPQGQELKVSVKFTVPTQTIDSKKLEAPLSALVYRNSDETPIKEFTSLNPGDVVEFTDDLPNSGIYTYSVTITTPEKGIIPVGVSEKASVTTSWIGEGIEPPFTNNFDTESDFNGWAMASTCYNNTYGWGYSNTKGYPYVLSSRNNDSYHYWLFTYPIYIETQAVYELEFTAGIEESESYTMTGKLAVFVGDEASIDAMTAFVGETEYNIGEGETVITIPFTSAGASDGSLPESIPTDKTNSYIGFKAYNLNSSSPSSYSTPTFYIDNLSVTPIYTSSVNKLTTATEGIIKSGSMWKAVTPRDVKMMQVFAASGQCVASSASSMVEAGHLAKGIYVVKVTTNEGIYNVKVIK